jgi:survival-of-motor-neuron-related-splicing factor 30
MEGEETVAELRAKLTEYNGQLAEVDALLAAEPGNSEYLQIKTDLVDVITLTKDLLKLKEAEEAAASPPTKGLPFIPPPTAPNAHANFFSVGTICEGRYSADGVWYKAKINTILEGGKYHVTYTDYGNEEVVSITDIRPLQEIAKKSTTLPLKRPAVPDAIQQIPKSLQVLPTDTEDQRLAKKKKIKAIKSANRLKTMDEDGKSKKTAWQSFQNKPKKNVPMSFTGRKKESIFKSSDGGKIGVTGSGMYTS